MTRDRSKGQALAEFAITLPLLTVFIMVVIELSLVLVMFYSQTSMTRETARWLAVHSKTTQDSDVAAHINQTMLPGMVGGTDTTPTTVNGDTHYELGNMKVWFTPCTWSGTICTHADRAAGQTLHVQMQYDVANLLFLPTNFRMGSLSVKLPTELPPYKVSVMVE